MIGLIHAFWNAVLVNRGGSQSSDSSAVLSEDDPESKAAVHQRAGLGFVHGAHGFGDILCGLRQRRLCHDANALAPAGIPEILDIGVADQ